MNLMDSQNTVFNRARGIMSEKQALVLIQQLYLSVNRSSGMQLFNICVKVTALHFTYSA